MSTPRSNNRSSTLRSERGYRTYIITTSRITSGDESNQRNGSGGGFGRLGEGFIPPPYPAPVSPL
jgi:hypothetical protein